MDGLIVGRICFAADGTLVGRKFGRLLVGVLVRVSDGLVVEVEGREERGLEVGIEEERTERPIVSRKEGAELDSIVGIEVGTRDEGGGLVRAVVGRKEGDAEGSEVEITVGIEVGTCDGRFEEERAVRTFVGLKVGGTLLGTYVGRWVGEELR
jgi:hypothetical protein